MVVGNQKCEWKIRGRLKQCNKNCVGKFCALHNYRVKNVGLMFSCRRCGIATKSETRLCQTCGANTAQKKLIYINKKSKKKYKNVLIELQNKFL
jgi:hypothetical protein